MMMDALNKCGWADDTHTVTERQLAKGFPPKLAVHLQLAKGLPPKLVVHLQPVKGFPPKLVAVRPQAVTQ